MEPNDKFSEGKSIKKVDESWKEQVEREKHQPESQTPAAPSTATPTSREELPGTRQQMAGAGEGLPEARFDLFLSGLAMDALIALGDAPHPRTNKQATQLPHARYLIDVLGILQEKTRGNLSVDEERLLKDLLYQLRMRYMAKAGG